MYRVKVFHVPRLNPGKLEEIVNEFLIDADIEVVDCRITQNEYNITYVIMYKVW